jgi:hypothetical protein
MKFDGNTIFVTGCAGLIGPAVVTGPLDHMRRPTPPKHEVLLDDLRIRPDPISGIDELAAVSRDRALLPSSSASRAATLWQTRDNRSRHRSTAPPRVRHFSGLI